MMIEKKAKGKGKGEAIIGIAMAVIMVASVFVAIVPTASAAGDKREIDLDDGPFAVFIGETLRIYNLLPYSTVIFESTNPDHTFSWAADASGTITKDITSAKVLETGYEVTYTPVDGTTVSRSDWVFFAKPFLNIEIEDTRGKEIEWATRGTLLTIDVDTNLPLDDVVKVKIRDPNGHVKTEAVKEIGELDYEITGYYISTDSWDIGEYEIWLDTVESEARGLDMVSDKKTITILKKGITIEAENEEPVVGEKVMFTVRAPRYTEFEFETSHPEDVVMTDLEDNPTKVSDWTIRKYDETDGTFRGKTDEDGLYKFVVKFKDDRTYTLDVSYYDATEAKTYEDDIAIDVEKATVVFDMPATCVIGEDLTIKGTISEGESVDIYIEDKLQFDDETVTDGEFEVDWDTSGETPGTIRIDVYIDCDDCTADKDDIPAGIDEDGTTTVRLIELGLAAKQPRNVVAEGDDYTIEGIATGVDGVDIVLVGPEGYPAVDPGLGVLNGLEITSTSVSVDDEFSEDIEMTEGLDLGTWKTMVFSPGRDAEYGDLGIGAGELESIPTAVFAGKDQDQIVALLKDHTVDVAGSDDLLVELTFEVETPYVRFEPIKSVTIGKPLEITGKTNREPGTIIVISTFAGPTDLPAVITEVEWPTQDQGIFNANIDTTYAVAGTYTLQADDGDGHTDTATVEILPPKPPTPEVSVFTDKKEYSPGDVMKINIRISNPADDTQTLSFEWYLGIPEYDLWAEMAATPINLPPGYDQTFTASIPVGDWGTESFSGCHIVSLTDTTTKKVVSVDSTAWIYMPSALPESKTSVEIAKEITKEIEGVELQLPS